MDLVQSTAPDFEALAVSREEARLHLRHPPHDDDTLIDTLIGAANEFCESYTNRQFVTATWKLKIDDFPDADGIVLPKPPIQSISSITYIDSDGVEQTVTSTVYRILGVASLKSRGTLVLDYDQSWPTHRGDKEKVIITYVAGYGAAAAVPYSIKAAIKLVIGHLYENREATIGQALQTIPIGVMSLLDQERIVP